MKALYTFVGLLWGLVLGGVAGFVATGAIAGFFWIFLFGDDTWPSSTTWLIPGIGLIVSLLVIIICTVAGYIYAARLNIASDVDHSRARRRGYLLSGGAILATLAIGGLVYLSGQGEDRRKEQSEDREVGFARLIQGLHQITSIDISGPDGDALQTITVHIKGSRQGQYQLKWTIRETFRKKALLEGTEVIDLNVEEMSVSFAFSLRDIKASYKKIVLNSHGGALVEEDFLAEVFIIPVLSDLELQALPDSEQQHLKLGESSLIQTVSERFPVRFIIQ